MVLSSFISALMRGTTTPEDPRERELYRKKQREHPEQKSGLVEHLRAASKLQGANAWEFLCGVCSHVNLIRSSDPDATIGQHFCERCGTTLKFANKEYAKPAMVMKWGRHFHNTIFFCFFARNS